VPFLYNNNMIQILRGDRICKQGQVRLACSATLFNTGRDKVLLTRRTDNGQWCLPGGHIDPGETVSEGCEREVWEETGLKVCVTHLTGIYSNPHELIVYPDAKVQVISMNFNVKHLDGQISLSSETTSIDWFSVDEAILMDLFHGHAERIRDALTSQEASFLR
jgi:8-oxo-dGTP pyrophosphatase MutT (NUDIX family)